MVIRNAREDHSEGLRRVSRLMSRWRRIFFIVRVFFGRRWVCNSIVLLALSCSSAVLHKPLLEPALLFHYRGKCGEAMPSAGAEGGK